MPINEASVCQACGAGELREVPEFALLSRVTSDCVPFREGGRLSVCSACGVGQSLPDAQWFAEITEIYSKYDIYHQSGGQEQHVFEAASARMRPRSEVLLDRLAPHIPHSGKLLDVGCGNGVTLSAFAGRGGWELHGLDIHDRNLPRLSGISGFQKLHTCSADNLNESFDVITLVHALEHVPDPCRLLQQLKRKTRDSGIVFIQVPNAALNPFDCVIADHLLHFTPEALRRLLERAGFRRIGVFTDWVAKEISLLAQPGPNPQTAPPAAVSPDERSLVLAQLSWLERVTEAAQAMAATTDCFGLFGSSIAATWLWSKVSRQVRFFVDEDPTRAGRSHLGCPILPPSNVPAGASVFLPLPNVVADAIRARLKGLPFQLHVPPVLFGV